MTLAYILSEKAPKAIVIHCKTEVEAKQLLQLLHTRGKTWRSGISYLETTNWEEYKENTYYNLRAGEYDRKTNYSRRGFTIIPFKKLQIEFKLKPTKEA